MKKSKKIQKNLDARMKGYSDLFAIAQREARVVRDGQYSKPGSRSGRK